MFHAPSSIASRNWTMQQTSSTATGQFSIFFESTYIVCCDVTDKNDQWQRLLKNGRFFCNLLAVCVLYGRLRGLLLQTTVGVLMQCLNCRGLLGSSTPIVFSTPLTPCQIMHWELCTIYIRFTSQFWLGSDRRKVQPPASLWQFKHCFVAIEACACSLSVAR